jgi:hypothetical protein
VYFALASVVTEERVGQGLMPGLPRLVQAGLEVRF